MLLYVFKKICTFFIEGGGVQKSFSRIAPKCSNKYFNVGVLTKK